MDDFARTFHLTPDQTRALEFFSIFSPYWRCGHRRVACFVRGRCVLEHYSAAIEETLILRDQESATRIVEAVTAAVSSRREPWNQLLQAAQRASFPSPDATKRAYDSLLEETARDIGALPLTTEGECASRTYYDDTRSLLPQLFVPLDGDECVNIVDSLRVERYLLLFYTELPADVRFVYQREPEVHGIVNHYLRWAPDAPACGSDAPVTWLVFLPSAVRQLFDDGPYLPILKTLDADTAFIRAQSSSLASRLFFQRFAIDGAGMPDVLAALEQPLRGSSLVTRHCYAAQTLETLFFPAALVRGWFSNLYSDEEMITWFGANEHCQACYATSHTRAGRLLCVDSRMVDYVGGDALRSLRPIRHGGLEFDQISMSSLGQDEMLTRMGDHWCAYPCRSAREAIIVTGTLLHRFLRAGGLGGPFLRRLAVESVARCFLHWCPSGPELAPLYHLQLCAVMRVGVESVITEHAYADLGAFLNALLQARLPNTRTQSAMYRSLLSCTLYALSLAAPPAMRPRIAPPPMTPANTRRPPPPPFRR
ncbi:tubule protein [Mono Lake orbivirus]|nr:tubule protein [Mono Lake orbivirus]